MKPKHVKGLTNENNVVSWQLQSYDHQKKLSAMLSVLQGTCKSVLKMNGYKFDD